MRPRVYRYPASPNAPGKPPNPWRYAHPRGWPKVFPTWRQAYDALQAAITRGEFQ